MPPLNLPLYVAIAGSAVAGYIDLRTTEIPDEIPLSMAAFGLFWGGLAWIVEGSTVLFTSLLVGGLFFAFGFAMYYTGQWGGGDAKLLAAIGVLVPQAPAVASATLFPFPVSYLLNVFLVGALYISVYAFLVSFRDPSITSAFIEDVRGGMKQLAFFTLALTGGILAAVKAATGGITGRPLVLGLSLVPGGVALFLLWRFLKTVENVGFHNEVSTDELEVGDMLGEEVPDAGIEDNLLRGLDEGEIEDIQEARDTVVVREGVRFGPVFVLALLYTVYSGDIVSLVVV